MTKQKRISTITIFLITVIFCERIHAQEDSPVIELKTGKLIGDTIQNCSVGFEFKIDWNQWQGDTLKVRITHARGTETLLFYFTQIYGNELEFKSLYLKELKVGDRLDFEIKWDERKFTKSYTVQSISTE